MKKRGISTHNEQPYNGRPLSRRGDSARKEAIKKENCGDRWPKTELAKEKIIVLVSRPEDC